MQCGQQSQWGSTRIVGDSRQRSREDLLGIGLGYWGLQKASKLKKSLVLPSLSQSTPEILSVFQLLQSLQSYPRTNDWPALSPGGAWVQISTFLINFWEKTLTREPTQKITLGSSPTVVNLTSLGSFFMGKRSVFKYEYPHVKMKVGQSCLTLGDPRDYTVHGILQVRILEWVAFPFSRDLPNPGIKPRSPALQADSLPAEPQGKLKNTGVGSLSLF